ncbi:hypothetical protein JW964_25995, partial [candidate division KSB1 bacterium]|nr:hypothetical protein [candidate division KSB1 bacterium]
MKKRILFKFGLIIFIVTSMQNSILAQIVEIYDIYPKQVACKGFELKTAMEVQIEATIGTIRSKKQQLSNCWILNAETRELEWEISKSKLEKSHSRKNLEINEQIFFQQGKYEVYYAIDPQQLNRSKNLWGILFNRDEKRKKLSAKWGITIQPANKAQQDLNFLIFSPAEEDEQAIVQLTNIYDDEYHKKGFTLTAPVKVRIYAIGEGTKSGRQMFDFAWITDFQTRKRIWEMDYRKTKHAGGAIKNRCYDRELTLAAGKYMVHFVTDDSHSSERWNQMPPYDPNHWGITIWALNGISVATTIKPFKESNVMSPIIELTRIRNNRFESRGFSLAKPTKLHILALGESSNSNRKMVDYGWIVDTDTRGKVWEMKYNETEYAGGGNKNRVFDGFITLPAGNYLVCFRTDDSHAFRSWNVDEPWMPELWGITISCAEENCQTEVHTFDESGNENVLAQMIRVTNDEKIYQRFELSLPTEIRIYAIGEGSRGKMFDYGWLENSVGEKIWEMKFSSTKHAGGGTKNRLIN